MSDDHSANPFAPPVAEESRPVPDGWSKPKAIWMRVAEWVWDHKVLVAGLVLLLNVGPFWSGQAGRAFAQVNAYNESPDRTMNEQELDAYTSIKSRYGDYAIAAAASYLAGGLLCVAATSGSLWKLYRKKQR